MLSKKINFLSHLSIINKLEKYKKDTIKLKKKNTIYLTKLQRNKIKYHQDRTSSLPLSTQH